MNKLFFDIGNSKIKFASIVKRDYQYHGSFLVTDFLDNISDYLFDNLERPDAVYISSVASAEVVEKIRSQIQSEWQLIPVRLEAQQSCCGLQSGYADFHRLGVDRWLAMIGAHSLTKEPFVVIDAGTALTIDAVIDGQHHGGFIVPGLRTQADSLFVNAAALDSVEQDSLEGEESKEERLLATNTSEAILGGTLYMVSAYLNEIISDLNAQLQTQFKVFVTGGDADKIAKILHFDSVKRTDLVLKGAVYMVSQIEGKK